MQLEITVPIIVNDDIICEFEAAVDIKVTNHGCEAQTSGPPEACYPGEAPEWEVEAVYVEIQKEIGVINSSYLKGNFVSEMVECPDELLIFITQYIEGDRFQDMVMDEIGLEGQPNE